MRIQVTAPSAPLALGSGSAGLGTKDAADAAAQSLRTLRQSGQDVSRVLHGLESASAGGAQGILGTVSALRGLIGILTRVGSVLMGPVGIALGAAAAGIALLGKVARDNQRAIEGIFREAAEGSARLKGRYEELDAAAEKSLESQIEEVRELTKAYDSLINRMDGAAKRANELNDTRAAAMGARTDRDEQAALARAKTPEERERIAADFTAKRDTFKQQREADTLLDSEQNAQNRIREAVDVAGRKREALRGAEIEARVTEKASQDTTALAGHAARDRGAGSPAHLAALEEAKTAARAAKNAKENLGKVRGEAEAVSTASEAEIEQARHTLDLVGIQREALKLQVEANAIARANAARPKLEGLKAAAQTAAESGNLAAQDKAVADFKSTEASLKKKGPDILAAAQGVVRAAEENTQLVITSINGQSTALKKQNRIILNSREQTQ